MEDLIRIGLDIPNYPQLIEMGEQFLDDLVKQDCGIIKDGRRYRLEGVEIGDVSSPLGLEPYLWTLKYLRERGLAESVKLKASVTGPFTLASYLVTGDGAFPFNTAISDIERVEKLAEILSISCEKIAQTAYMISIDEPILSVIVGGRLPFEYGEEDIIGIYDKLKRSCGKRFTGTHVCGRISPRLADILLRTELDFLSHEFHDSPRNFDVYDPNRVLESEKVLAVGCVSSKNPQVESVKEILRLMEKSRKFGEDIIFTPDCGFKNLRVGDSKEQGYIVSIKKLVNMIKAASKYKAKIND